MSARPTRRAARLLAAALVLSLAGCYAVEESADRTVIRFSGPSRLAIVLVPACLMAVGGALCCVRATRVVGALGLAGTALLGATILPGMYLDSVVITPTEITQKTGLWFAPTVKTVRYADVRSISIRTVQKRKGPDARLWVARRTDGTVQEIDPGDLWEFNEELVVRKLSGYGVTFE